MSCEASLDKGTAAVIVRTLRICLDKPLLYITEQCCELYRCMTST